MTLSLHLVPLAPIVSRLIVFLFCVFCYAFVKFKFLLSSSSGLSTDFTSHLNEYIQISTDMFSNTVVLKISHNWQVNSVLSSLYNSNVLFVVFVVRLLNSTNVRTWSTSTRRNIFSRVAMSGGSVDVNTCPQNSLSFKRSMRCFAISHGSFQRITSRLKSAHQSTFCTVDCNAFICCIDFILFVYIFIF